MQAFILSPYSWKAYGIRLNVPGLCNIGKIFHRLPWLAFVLGFLALFTLGLVCPTCGHLGHVRIQLVGFLFFPQTKSCIARFLAGRLTRWG